ncbi:MAG: hypothetical protein KDE56_32615 [Anaerolineales bacterium]|nr:hypothetical protein [Anaerolineales bacterium]
MRWGFFVGSRRQTGDYRQSVDLMKAVRAKLKMLQEASGTVDTPHPVYCLCCLFVYRQMQCEKNWVS